VWTPSTFHRTRWRWLRVTSADYQLTARIRLLESDVFAALDKERYDLIVSNPPYVKAESMRSLPAEYQTRARPGAGQR
jgi:methylase of polypeptide subunit release factors